MASLKRDLSPADRTRMDSYLSEIREVERRIQRIEARNESSGGSESRQLAGAPAGVPDSFEEHVKLMFDIQALAFAADITRVFSFKMGRDGSARVYPESGSDKPFHPASHHGGNEKGVKEFFLINKYHVSMLPYFLDKLKNIQEGESNMLDKTLIMYGSPMGDSNLHNHRRCPLILLGHANKQAGRQSSLEGSRRHADGERDAQRHAYARNERHAVIWRQHDCRSTFRRIRNMASTRAVPRLAIVGAAVLLSAAAAPRHASDPTIADAEMRGDTSAVRLLLKQGADVNAAQGDGMTALHWAAMHGDVDQTRMLVYAGARLEASTRNGNYTPLHLAAQTGKTSVIKALVQAGADVNAATTAGGATPLHYAAANGNADAIVALLDKGAKVDARESAWSETPLMWAAASNRVNALQVLVSRGADLKAVSKLEDMPAREKAERAALTLRARRVAALKSAEQGPPAPRRRAWSRRRRRGATDGRSRRSERRGNSAPPPLPTRPVCVRVHRCRLIRRGGGRGDRGPSYADLIGNKGGLSALLFAVRQGNAEAVTALLKAGADVNQVSTGDHTSPLLMATINGHFDLAKMLLERGANAKLASDAGTTPLYATINVQWAAKSLYPQPTAQLRQQTTYLELMEALLKAGADPNARLTKHLWYMSYNFDLLGVNTTGATPFWRAAYGTDVAGDEVVVGARRGSEDSDDQARRPAARR